MDFTAYPTSEYQVCRFVSVIFRQLDYCSLLRHNCHALRHPIRRNKL